VIRATLIGSAAVLLLTALGSVYLLGRAHEARAHAAERIALQEAYLDARSRADKAERLRLAMQAERDRLAQELENEARDDTDAGRAALPSRSVQRLNAR
jgi:biopolymer transport protein ExbB/TolQ